MKALEAIGRAQASVEQTARTCAYAHSTLTRLLVTAGAVAVVGYFWSKKKEADSLKESIEVEA